MATADYIISNQSGASFRTDLNNTLAAIVSNNSNSSEPATKYAYQWWADTSAAVMKIRNSANDGWIELFQLDGTITLENGTVTEPALANRSDLNTGVFFSGADKLNIAAGGVERIEFGSTELVINEDGANCDFRVEGDTASNLLFCDAGNDRVGILTNSPAVELEVSGAIKSNQNANDGVTTSLRTENGGTGTTQASIGFASNNSQKASIRAHVLGNGNMFFHNNNDTVKMTLLAGGILLLGSTSNVGNGKIQAFIDHGSTAGESGFTSVDTTSMAEGVGGEISFYGKFNSSGDYAYLGHIRGRKANASSGDTACNLTFHTRPNAVSPIERMRINHEGLLLINEAKDGMSLGFGQQQLSVKAGVFSPALFESTGATLSTMLLTNSSTSAAVNMVDMRCARSGNSAFTFFIMRSGASSSSSGDTELKFVGDGNAFADGSFTGGGADYAEYFEWADGNSSDEDRRGYTVVLDGNKIRKSTSSDAAATIIGVVSGNPSVVGDGDVDRWKQKYQKDDYGTYIRDENGDKILNSDFDDTKTYISRAERKEWDIIGLMGKIRVRKGQTMGTNWIKMQDISDTVEEWLVR